MWSQSGIEILATGPFGTQLMQPTPAAASFGHSTVATRLPLPSIGASTTFALTDAERDVALRGETNESIARARSTSPNTVANQLRAIYARLGVKSRTEMVRLLSQGS